MVNNYLSFACIITQMVQLSSIFILLLLNKIELYFTGHIVFSDLKFINFSVLNN